MQATSGFSADTEILTRRGGWVTFDRLTYMDEVATRSPDGRFEWQVPERITWQPYEGDMVWLHSRTTDLQVLPGAEIRYMRRNKTRRGPTSIELLYVETPVLARDVVGEKLPLVATSHWEPAATSARVAFTAKRAYSYGGRLANHGHDFAATAEDFAAFMGMYLAEGNLGSNPYYVFIWQKAAGRGFDEYQDLLDRLLSRSVPHFSGKGCWSFSNKALYTFLKTCGGYAWTKIIPAEVLDLASCSLEQFWRHYNLGDGTEMQAPGRKSLDVISTTSRAMADRLQEILQKLGGWGLIQVVDRSKYTSNYGKRPCYRIVRRAGTVAFASTIERIPYSGMAGSVRVNAPSVYVRRNRRPVWSGM